MALVPLAAVCLQLSWWKYSGIVVLTGVSSVFDDTYSFMGIEPRVSCILGDYSTMELCFLTIVHFLTVLLLVLNYKISLYVPERNSLIIGGLK